MFQINLHLGLSTLFEKAESTKLSVRSISDVPVSDLA